MSVDENTAPLGTILSPSQSPPPAKKERRSLVVSPTPLSPRISNLASPPRLSPRFEKIREVVSYDKETVDELVGHLISLVEKSENEALYWSTLYEESQKDLFQMKEEARKEQKEEADYIDPEVIPQGPRRNSKQPLEGGGGVDGDAPSGTASSRWGLSLRGVLNAVVRNPYSSVASEGGS